MMLNNCNNAASMATDEMKKWDAENGYVDTLYSMEKIS